MKAFKLSDFIHYRRLRWASVAGLLAIVCLVVFRQCLHAEDTRCAAITGVIGVFALCITAWHSLIYIAERRGGL